MGKNSWRCVETAVLGRRILCRWLLLDDGAQFVLTGGDLSHVGAVSAADPGQPARTLSFPGHRDQELSGPWAEKLAGALNCRVCVTCGIHYDNLSRENLKLVITAAEALLTQVLESRDSDS